MVKHSPLLRNIELSIAYSGTHYSGWQIQPKHTTVQGLLQGVLVRILGEPKIRSIGTSRTDAGVHAHDQRVGFKTASKIPLAGLKRALNFMLPLDIRVLEIHERSVDFSVRYHAQAKHYSYFFYNGDKPPPFTAPFVWSYRSRLNEVAMAEAVSCFTGEQCFKALQSSRDFRQNTISTIYRADVFRQGRILCFDICGRRFLYHMVRIMAGSLLMVGKGEWSVTEFQDRFNSRDRTLMAVTAPARGLHLVKVFYESPLTEPFCASRLELIRRLD